MDGHETNNEIPTQEHIDTSQASRNGLRSKKNLYRSRIFSLIFNAPGGKTCDEVEVDLNLRHQTASCSIRFLTQDGWLYDTGTRRKTRAGRQAIVWKARMRPTQVDMKLSA